MQTSIEWLIDKVEDFIGLIPVDILEQAKEMHKQEIEDAINSISVECDHYDEHKWNYENGEQYYQETFI